MFKIIYNNIVLLIIFVVVMLVVSCDTVSRTEVTRIKSPDSIADAVLIKVNAGATASYAYEVYIIPTGGQPTQGNEIFKALLRNNSDSVIPYAFARASISFFSFSFNLTFF